MRCCARARWVHVASPFLQPGLDVAAIAARAAGTTSLDPGWDPAERWALEWEGFDVLLPNAQEAVRLAGEEHAEAAARRLAERGPLVVVKLGAEGALAAGGEVSCGRPRRASTRSTRPARATRSTPASSPRGSRGGPGGRARARLRVRRPRARGPPAGRRGSRRCAEARSFMA